MNSSRANALLYTPRRNTHRPPRLASPQTPMPTNNRLDFLKTPDAPRKVIPPRHPRLSESRTPSPPQRPLNDRFQYLKASPETTPNKKTTFVAMPTRQQWAEGYRPAWILRKDKDPPENYDVAFKIYKNYLKSGEVIFNEKPPVVDKAKNIGSAYLNKQNRKN